LRLSAKWLHIMLIPALLLVFVYSYLPMFGIVIAFQDYDYAKGISAFWESSFVGWQNFERVFGDPDFVRCLINTLRIALLKMTTMFIIPIMVAILLNEISKSYIKRSIQTLIYLPHFLSWIILAGVIKDVFGSDGIINGTLGQLFGTDPIYFLQQNSSFLAILIGTNIWKEFGFSTIVYLASISGIDPNLYEAAMIDGAGRLKQTWHVTLPGMKPIIVLCGVLSLGGILNAGFDQIFNLYSVPVYPVSDVIDTLVFRKGFQGGDYSLGSAIGLFNSACGFILIASSYYMAKKFANYEIF
jgi:putative aldouronate transport system permease protein